MALAAGSYVPASLVGEGFVHLSTPTSVTVPANALYAGRGDLALLVIDPDRLDAEVRWERGRPEDPPELVFPHLYGPMPTTAVVGVVPYRPGADGRFGPPSGLPDAGDATGRACSFDRWLAERRAAAVALVSGGVAVVEPRFPQSFDHNTLWITTPTPAAVVAGDADRVLGGAGLAHRAVTVDDPLTARGLEALGWTIQEIRVMVLAADAQHPAAGATDVAVTAVTPEAMAGLWRREWQRDLPAASADTIEQLVGAHALTDAIVRVVDLAVLDGGEAVAGASLRIDGATAAIESVGTDIDRRGAGLATAVVHEAVRRARAAGCDVVFLSAAADDWPRHWYERLGFAEVAHRFQARRL